MENTIVNNNQGSKCIVFAYSFVVLGKIAGANHKSVLYEKEFNTKHFSCIFLHNLGFTHILSSMFITISLFTANQCGSHRHVCKKEKKLTNSRRYKTIDWIINKNISIIFLIDITFIVFFIINYLYMDTNNTCVCRQFRPMETSRTNSASRTRNYILRYMG